LQPATRPLLGVVPLAVPPPQVVLGRLVGFDIDGRPLVDFDGNVSGPLLAAAAATYSNELVGAEVALLFIDGDVNRPLMLGCLQNNRGATSKVELMAEKELVLRCGRASITLTEAGKIIVAGSYLSSRSTGVVRISGGSVQIN
jgi:hypothetical protein